MMMIMKKIMCVVVCVGALIGCGGEPENNVLSKNSAATGSVAVALKPEDVAKDFCGCWSAGLATKKRVQELIDQKKIDEANAMTAEVGKAKSDMDSCLRSMSSRYGAWNKSEDMRAAAALVVKSCPEIGAVVEKMAADTVGK
jgi:hypothetical protein